LEKLIHLTDTHLVVPPGRLYGLDPLARLAPAVEAINREHADAKGVFVTGDLTHWGEEAAYRALREVLDRLAIPYYLAIGNHDARSPLRGVFPELVQDTHGFLQYAVAIESGICLVMDSVVEGSDIGLYDEERLDWLKEQLARHANSDIFLFLHHPPFEIGIKELDGMRIEEGADRMLRPLRRHGRVRHLFFGHVHRPIAGSWNGIPISSLFGTNHQIRLNLSDEKASGSLEPPQLGVVLIDSGSVVVHLHNYADDSPDYALDPEEAIHAQSVEALPRR